ncbi:G patch domain-containing protein 11 [Planococcus citri]|uniref:G patch domain-containing protein 11 n=1 Tax=Planococcus citri TaxID=170843 RepID=UPI0031F8E256
MSSDEDDYMSDKFLSGSVEQDIRPGLIKSHSDKRNFQALKRKIELDEINKRKNPNLRVLEKEKRQEGLEKPLESGNKGFAMLQKMGFKPGTSLGKSDTGRTEPIPINLKADREGLGRTQMKKEIIEKKLKEFRPDNISTTEYRSRLTGKVVQKQTESDFRKSQKICETLDTDKGILEPQEKWYWLSTDPEIEKEKKAAAKAEKRKKRMASGYDNDSDEYSENDDSEDASDEKDDDDDDDVPLDVSEKLNNITSYLRNTYYYCIWCSVKYNDEDDLKNECPGRTRDEH